MITVELTEPELAAVLRIVGAYVSRNPANETLAMAETKLDSALLEYEENHQGEVTA